MAHRPTVRAANGVVASGHHLATAAGIAALRECGSASTRRHLSGEISQVGAEEFDLRGVPGRLVRRDPAT